MVDGGGVWGGCSTQAFGGVGGGVEVGGLGLGHIRPDTYTSV